MTATIGMTDPLEGRSPEQWRTALLYELQWRQPWIRERLLYYEGDHPLPRAPAQALAAYRRLLKQSRTNWIQLIVDSVAERLQVVGFRFGDAQGDDDAWMIWQANGLDASAEIAQTDALVCGVNYVSVWPDENSPVGVRIAAEHPTQTIIAYDPDDRRTPLVSLKTWREPGLLRCWLCTASATFQWAAPSAGSQPPGSTTAMIWSGAYWQLTAQDLNPLGEVPIVEVVPWPRSNPLIVGMLPGRSEMDGVLDIQDRINTTILNRMIATEYAAFRQKWATGLTLPVARDADGNEIIDPLTGEPVHTSPFEIAVDRLLVAEDSTVKFGEFGESELAGYIRSVASDVNHLAAVTKTPPHYLLGEIVNASGDALKAAEAGLVAKVRRRAAHIGEAWEDVMRLSFSAIGDPRATDFQAEVIWGDFETRSDAELADALVKMASIGVPQEVLWQKWGASPQEIERWKQMAAEQAARQALAAPIPVPPGT